MLEHVLVIMTEENVLALTFIERMDEGNMFLYFSLIDNFDQLVLIESFLALFDKRDLRSQMRFSHVRIEEQILIVIMDGCLALD
jgi:hypothetical protein